jgi:hypothetical protein
LRAIGYPRNSRTCRGAEASRLPTGALESGKNRKGAGPWQIEQDVKALGHRDRETAARHLMHGMAIGRDHAADEFAEIDPKLT